MTARSQKESHAVSLGLGLMPCSLYGFDTCPSKHWRWVSPNVDADISMTTLLSNTFAHFTGPSCSKSKTIPLKSLLSLAVESLA